MKILIYSDNHWSQYSSILRQRGDKYSVRLENQIKSINWAEALAESNSCDFIVHLGDFFDSSSLNSEEITALKELTWAKLPHYLIVGNHEIGTKNLKFNSLNSLATMSNFEIIDSIKNSILGDLEIVFIPYTFDKKQYSIKSLFKSDNPKKIVFSHNDLKGVQMGKFVSKEGFEINDIANNCSLFINGHLHNGEKIGKNIINVGNLTGQNFGEDAFKYDHVALILDTQSMKIAVFENPYALNFYKLDFTENNSIDYINDISSKLKNNAVCTIKCKEENESFLKKRFGVISDPLVPRCTKVLTSRFILVPDISSNNAVVENISKVDHLQLFKDYVSENMGNTEVVISALQEVCK